jgi:hypothetical protein
LYPTQLSLLELKGAFFLTARSFDGLQVQPNRYLSDLSSLSEESSGRRRATRGEKIRRKFHRCMEFFLAEGGSCSYDAESIDDIEVPLRYKHLVKRWVPKDLPQVNTDFLSGQEDISHCSIIVTWLGAIFHGWHKGF